MVTVMTASNQSNSLMRDTGVKIGVSTLQPSNTELSADKIREEYSIHCKSASEQVLDQRAITTAAAVRRLGVVIQQLTLPWPVSLLYANLHAALVHRPSAHCPVPEPNGEVPSGGTVGQTAKQ